MKINFLIILISILFIATKCEKEAERNIIDKLYLINLQEEREDRNWRMQYDIVSSPFYADTTIKYKPLEFFEPDGNYIFKSKLFKYENPQKVLIYSNQGDSREYHRFGYFVLRFDKIEFKLHLYKYDFPEGGESYNLWFKDATNGKETYENGRYLFFTKNSDDNFEYTIDFNKAINPLCAYSKLYNCPIPTELDSVPFEIKAGEKKFR